MIPAQTRELGGSRRASYRRRRHRQAARALSSNGFPGSCSQITLFNPMLAELDVLSIDRPGYGSSTQSPLGELPRASSRGAGSWTRSCSARFEILAVSGGTPLGLTLAKALGDRVTRTTVGCGLGPLGSASIA